VLVLPIVDSALRSMIDCTKEMMLANTAALSRLLEISVSIVASNAAVAAIWLRWETRAKDLSLVAEL
jgi:hypothetical protein